METITGEQIEHIAKLARVGIDDAQKKKYADELAGILNYFQKLQQVETGNITPVKQITSLKDIIRNDEEKIFPYQMEILNNVPTKKNRFIKVKPIL